MPTRNAKKELTLIELIVVVLACSFFIFDVIPRLNSSKNDKLEKVKVVQGNLQAAIIDEFAESSYRYYPDVLDDQPTGGCVLGCFQYVLEPPVRSNEWSKISENVYFHGLTGTYLKYFPNDGIVKLERKN